MEEGVASMKQYTAADVATILGRGGDLEDDGFCWQPGGVLTGSLPGTVARLLNLECVRRVKEEERTFVVLPVQKHSMDERYVRLAQPNASCTCQYNVTKKRICSHIYAVWTYLHEFKARSYEDALSHMEIVAELRQRGFRTKPERMKMRAELRARNRLLETRLKEEIAARLYYEDKVPSSLTRWEKVPSTLRQDLLQKAEVEISWV